MVFMFALFTMCDLLVGLGLVLSGCYALPIGKVDEHLPHSILMSAVQINNRELR